MKAVFGIVLGAMLGFVPPTHAQGTTEDKLEIAGVRIGMTEVQVRAALAAFDPDLEVTSIMGVYTYSDGVNVGLRTPEFLDRLEGHKGGRGNVSIKVLFSGPGNDVRVIAMSRQAHTPNPPTQAQFTQSLIDKYGQPAGFNRASPGSPVWEGAGKPSCIRARDSKGQVAIDYGSSIGASDFMQGERVEDLLRSGTTVQGLRPTDLTRCGTFLSYYLPREPVTSFQAYLYDLGAIVVTHRSRAAWVEQLQVEAVRKRQAQGQTPRL